MTSWKAVLGVLVVTTTLTFGQEEGAAAPPVVNLDVEDDGVRVAVLGYHDFSETDRETAMRIRTSKFRKQMEALRDLGIEVVSMEDFSAWKKGEKAIPQKSAVITIDDGWKSTYTDAFPILKEFGYPFTIFLYKEYIDGGGKALTTPMITEMIAGGGTVGSHSTSHPYPQAVKQNRKRGPEAFDQFLDKEMRESRLFLEEKFKQQVTTYAYPGGYFTEEMLAKAEQVGYTHLFTVQPGKVSRALPNFTLPRYIVLGDYDKIFDYATSFRESQTSLPTGTASAMIQELPHPVKPEPGAIINSRLPEITVDLSALEDFDPASLKMQVAGFGQVPANFATEGKVYSWQVNRRLRQPVSTVVVSWNDTSGKPVEKPLRWSFKIDREAAYLPEE